MSFGESTLDIMGKYVVRDLSRWLRPLPLTSRVQWLIREGAPAAVIRALRARWEQQ